MANPPRKFADKLEIIRRKEEEANAEFEQVMRECKEVKGAGETSPGYGPNMHLPSHQRWIGRTPNEYMKCGMRQIWKGGSLPNVHSSPSAANSVSNVNVNQQQSYNLNDGGFQQSPQGYGGVGGIRHGRNMDPPSGPIYPSRGNKYHPHRYMVTQPYKNSLLQQQPSLVEEQPENLGWRRAASDSAIQQTLGEPPKPNNVNGSGSNLPQPSSGRIIPQSPNSQNADLHSITRSPPVSIRFPETNRHNSHIKMAADTSSLPDLSNLSIPSPIQNPIDIEGEGKSNAKGRDPAHFQAPYQIPSRSRMKQIYNRQGSASDIIETLHRGDVKPNINNLYTDNTNNGCHNNNSTGPSTNMTQSVSAPLSPVTPPPFFWNSTPISPLATTDILPQPSSAPTSDLQQQLFQIHDGVRDNGNCNSASGTYNFPTPGDEESYNNFCTNNYINNKQNVYRMSSGPPSLTSASKSLCDHQLESALMRVKAQQGENDLDASLLRMKGGHPADELSPADLNSVRVALHPLDFDDVQMLSDNVQLVDQSAEEQFRLDRAAYNP